MYSNRQTWVTYGPGKLGEVIGLENQLVEVPQPAHLVRDALQVVLLQVQQSQSAKGRALFRYRGKICFKPPTC